MSLNHYQKGQSSILALVFAGVMGTTMFFVYNSSQLLSERQQAKMLADHTANATAVKQARLLNMNAYINRAQVANELAIAQAVSVGGWAKYASTTSRNIGTITSWIPGVGSGLMSASNMLQTSSDALGPWIQAYGANVHIIDNAQAAMNTGANHDYAKFPSRFVSSNNNDYKASLLIDRNGKLAAPMKIMESYTGRRRKRMADVIHSSQDGFIVSRGKRWFRLNLGLFKVSIEKRGGIHLVGLDEWKSTDTLSLHTWRARLSWRGIKWRHSEIPVGYGSSAVSQTGRDSDRNRWGGRWRWVRMAPEACRANGGRVIWYLCLVQDKHETTHLSYGGSRGRNPRATQFAQSSMNRASWDVRNNSRATTGVGIPGSYELADLKGDVSFPYSIGISKNAEKAKLTNRKSNVETSKKLVPYDNLDKKKIYAMSKAEVYFQKPWRFELRGNQINHELPSLYSPYWQVRLSDKMNSVDRLVGSVQGK